MSATVSPAACPPFTSKSNLCARASACPAAMMSSGVPSDAPVSAASSGRLGVSNVMITVAPGEVRFIQVTTWPSLGTTQTQREQAMSDLDNDGEPLVLGFKYSFAGGAAPLAKDPNTTNL